MWISSNQTKNWSAHFNARYTIKVLCVIMSSNSHTHPGCSLGKMSSLIPRQLNEWLNDMAPLWVDFSCAHTFITLLMLTRTEQTLDLVSDCWAVWGQEDCIPEYEQTAAFLALGVAGCKNNITLPISKINSSLCRVLVLETGQDGV